MAFYADLHIHSKHSRATSRDCDLEHLAWWARRKGISVVATGDFTHPVWFDELREKLLPAEAGLFRLRPEVEREVERNLPAACRGPVRFMLEVEISTIYKAGEKTRKVHHLIYAASFETAERLRRRLAEIGNLASDGRPILGLDSRHLLEITLEAGPDAYLVPAHIWTPWFSALGSKSGFDSIDDCYGDLAGHIFAVETGLSSDPPMNWRISGLDRFTLVSNSDAHSPPMLGREACVFGCELDYFAMRRALETGEGYGGTVEFFPEEGKYHLDGHRACGVCLEPQQTREKDGRCPECGKPVTVGVMHRVETLADRPRDHRREGATPFRSLVPLPEIVAEISRVGPKSKTVERQVASLVERLGPELTILEELPVEEAEGAAGPLLGEALRRLRAGEVRCQGGYDGEYGVIRLFAPEEIEHRAGTRLLFEPPPAPGGGAEKRPAQVGRGGGHQGSRTGRGGATAGGPAEGRRRASSPAEGNPEGQEPGAAPGASAVAAAGAGEGARGGGEETGDERAGSEPATAEPAQLSLIASSVLDSLDPEQRSAAEIVEGALLVVAGPGTGKTRTLTHRLAHLVAEAGAAPEECLAVTFTRRAAAEMRQRLTALLPRQARSILVTTFHGLGATILRREAGALDLAADFRIADAAECNELAGELFGLPPGRARRLRGELARQRRERAAGAGGDTPAGAAEMEAAEMETAELQEKLAAYEAALAERGLVDFDDLLILPVRLFARRPEVLSSYRRRYRWVSIDEYQDIDPLQYRLVRQVAPAGANLCAIGDPDQSIYRFRGADVGFFLRFQEDYPGVRVVHLHRNYRSSRTIVDAALQAIRPESLVAGRRLEAVRSVAAERIVVHGAASERAEAELVAHAIEELLGGTSYYSLDSGRVGSTAGRELAFSDFAVLYRTAAQAAPVAEALARAGIPFQERTHQPLAQRRGVEAVVRLLRQEMGEGGAEPSGSARNGPGTRASVEARLRDAARRLAAGEAEGAGADGAALAAAAELLAPLAARCGDDLEAFLTEIALGAEVDTWDPRAERVSLLTLHAAKGLEFPVVFLVGCEDGLLPLAWAGERSTGPSERVGEVARGAATDRAEADPPAALGAGEPTGEGTGEASGERATDRAEERRLFFVGLTRARSLLFLSYARRRRWRGKVRETSPSPFFADVEEALLERRRPQEAEERGPQPRQLGLF